MADLMRRHAHLAGMLWLEDGVPLPSNVVSGHALRLIGACGLKVLPASSPKTDLQFTRKLSDGVHRTSFQLFVFLFALLCCFKARRRRFARHERVSCSMIACISRRFSFLLTMQRIIPFYKSINAHAPALFGVLSFPDKFLFFGLLALLSRSQFFSFSHDAKKLNDRICIYVHRTESFIRDIRQNMSVEWKRALRPIRRQFRAVSPVELAYALKTFCVQDIRGLGRIDIYRCFHQIFPSRSDRIQF